MRRQIKLMGTGYDWTREFATCDPEYYKWNQWFFLRLYERGLAYKRETPVNWCPNDQTVLANEQVHDGRCWRCDALVERRNLSQWNFKITAFADRLLAGLDRLKGWPERIVTMQRNWIGRSEGSTFAFDIEGVEAQIEVYTTRVDTVYGVTFLAVAAEHPVVAKLLESAPAGRATVEAFAESLRSKSELERTQLMEKSGVPTGAFAIHPLSGERVPIWVTNYVLAEYGTGAVMGVPAHDERDFDFARKHGLPIVEVIVPWGHAATNTLRRVRDDGVLSRAAVQRTTRRRRAAITERFAAMRARPRHFRLAHSRQRYWGTPILMIYCGAMDILARRSAPGRALRASRYRPGLAAGQRSVFVNVTCPQCGPANAIPIRWTRSSTRPGITCAI